MRKILADKIVGNPENGPQLAKPVWCESCGHYMVVTLVPRGYILTCSGILCRKTQAIDPKYLKKYRTIDD